MLIGLHGKARSGKDTAAIYLAQRFGFEVYSFANPIKTGLKAMFGLTDAQLEDEDKDKLINEIGKTPRELMQTLGTEWGRQTINHDIWLWGLEKQFAHFRVYAAKNKLQFLPLIKDVRFENEADWVRGQGGLIIHIQRNNARPVRSHVSEAGVAVQAGDVVISNNDSLTQFYQKLTDIVLDELAKRGQ